MQASLALARQENDELQALLAAAQPPPAARPEPAAEALDLRAPIQALTHVQEWMAIMRAAQAAATLVRMPQEPEPATTVPAQAATNPARPFRNCSRQRFQ